MTLVAFRYLIEYSTSEMFTTYLVVAQQFSEQPRVWYPNTKFNILVPRFFNQRCCVRAPYPSSYTSLPCSAKHKKPVSDKCIAEQSVPNALMVDRERITVLVGF